MRRLIERWLMDGRVRSFLKAVDDLMAPALAEAGFVLEESRAERDFAACLFGGGSLYVELTINLVLRESPNHCNVVLGEGERTWPERDWNNVALWVLARDHPAGSPDAAEYLLTPAADVHQVVERMRNDLLTYAADFLRGDLAAFRAARASVNKNRPPYFIDGRIDPESAALKERFSS